MSLCKCGCEQELPPTTRIYPNGRVVKNVHKLYIQGHNGRKKDRIKVDLETGCWIWQLNTNDRGYGQFQRNHGKDVNGKRIVETVRAHNHYWEVKNGPIPEGKELDHVCRNRRCVNPDHLEPVTHEENMRRSPHTKLDIGKVKLCKLLRKQGFTFVAIGALLGIHRTTASKAVHGINWGSIGL